MTHPQVSEQTGEEYAGQHELLTQINLMAHAPGTNAAMRDTLQKAYKEITRNRATIESLTAKLGEWEKIANAETDRAMIAEDSAESLTAKLGEKEGELQAWKSLELLLRGQLEAAEAKLAEKEAEMAQAHDDLDTLDVPRDEHGLTHSLAGRILHFARINRLDREAAEAKLASMWAETLEEAAKVAEERCPYCGVMACENCMNSGYRYNHPAEIAKAIRALPRPPTQRNDGDSILGGSCRRMVHVRNAELTKLEPANEMRHHHAGNHRHGAACGRRRAYRDDYLHHHPGS